MRLINYLLAAALFVSLVAIAPTMAPAPITPPATTGADDEIRTLLARMEAQQAEARRLDASIRRSIHALQMDMVPISEIVPEQYRLLVVLEARRHGLDPSLLAALGQVETGWRCDQIGADGEVGCLQVLPSTGAWIAQRLGYSTYDLADPTFNLRFGAWYLAQCLDETGAIDQALACYNGGPRGWEIPAARGYSRRVLAVMEEQGYVD